MTVNQRHLVQPKYTARNKTKDLAFYIMAQGGCISPVGSRCIAGAYSKTSDWDYLVYRDMPSLLVRQLINMGFKEDGSDVKESEFTSLKYTCPRSGDVVNAIVARQKQFYENFLSAQVVATNSRVRDKGKRVALFSHMRGDKILTKDKLETILG